jgi:hypothetical protein
MLRWTSGGDLRLSPAVDKILLRQLHEVISVEFDVEI